MATKYYAVKNGRVQGIFTTWEECKAQVEGFSYAEYKSFKTLEEAKEYMGLDEKRSSLALPEDIMVAYVDGSYNQAIPAYSYGIVIFAGEEVIKDCAMFLNDENISMRNVAGEIKGAQVAMEEAVKRGYKTLHIYHDYEGIAAWCEGRWKANKPGTIAYKNYYDQIKNDVKVIFHKVVGHSGDKYNEEADRLAASAFDKYIV